MRASNFAFAGVLALGLLATPAMAAMTYNFNMTFDGTDVSLDNGSDVPDGTMLSPGDSFILNIHTAGNAFWTVLSDYDIFVPLDFLVPDEGVRNADISTVWLLDGSIEKDMTETGVDQEALHVGAQSWDLPSGFAFDTVILTWMFNSISPVIDPDADPEDPVDDSPINTIISAANADFFESYGSDDRPFFRSSSIAYVNAVPLPASLPLLLAAIGALAGIRRLRRARA